MQTWKHVNSQICFICLLCFIFVCGEGRELLGHCRFDLAVCLVGALTQGQSVDKSRWGLLEDLNPLPLWLNSGNFFPHNYPWWGQQFSWPGDQPEPVSNIYFWLIMEKASGVSLISQITTSFRCSIEIIELVKNIPFAFLRDLF